MSFEGKVPRFKELILLKYTNENGSICVYKLREAFAPCWKDLGRMFGNHESALRSIEMRRRDIPEDCFDDVLSQWQSNGSVPREAYPVTWGGLIQALRDLGRMAREVDKLETALRNRVEEAGEDTSEDTMAEPCQSVESTNSGQRNQRRIGFQNFQLFKAQSLGIGSFGAVCKAKCDDLLCAAKIIHPTLVDPTARALVSRGKEHRLPISRFNQECQLLCSLKHPNIIQYLGTRQDPENGLPVLLMELMDESLTSFLERSLQKLPYDIEVTFSHDIALALSFLHSNGIIHRDLSSNNVLIGKCRAKVSDFGMAKFIDINPRATRVSLTQTPGAEVYMPPETTRKPPVYNEKIDCFCFGVLGVQIMTQQYPNPTDRFKEVRVQHPQFPSGSIEVRVSEVDRREEHISLINQSHPLLTLALDCLKDKEKDRPSAREICDRLAIIRQSPQLTESATPQQNTFINLQWKKGKDALYAMSRGPDMVVHGSVVYLRPGATNQVHGYDSTSSTWFRVPDSPHEIFSLAIVDDLLTSIGGWKDGQPTGKLLSLVEADLGKPTWVEKLPPMPTKRIRTCAVSTGRALIVIGGEGYTDVLKVVEVLDLTSKQWTITVELPEPLSVLSSTICEDRIYILGSWRQSQFSVYTCSLSALLLSRQLVQSAVVSVWNQVASLPVTLSTCVTFQGRLLALGGDDSHGNPTTAVRMYHPENDSWSVISHMMVPRSWCSAAVLPGYKLIVVGGCSTALNGSCSNSVEIASL